MARPATRGGFKTLCDTSVRDRSEFEVRVKACTSQPEANAVGVCYYSDHGVQAGNANFLIPTQVQPTAAMADPTAVLYAVDDLFTRPSQQTTRFHPVMMDPCRTDLFARAGPDAVRPQSLSVRKLSSTATAQAAVRGPPVW